MIGLKTYLLNHSQELRKTMTNIKDGENNLYCLVR